MRQQPRILLFAGSARSQSLNGKLAALMARTLAMRDAHPTLISLADYPLPLYDGDLEAGSGVPEMAHRLVELFGSHHGVFIAAPEYNHSITPLLKNTLDWMSRIKTTGKPASPWKERVFAIGAASPGYYGGLRALLHLRQVLSLGLGATVLNEQVVLPQAASAIDGAGGLVNDSVSRQVDTLAERLIEETTRLATLERH